MCENAKELVSMRRSEKGHTLLRNGDCIVFHIEGHVRRMLFVDAFIPKQYIWLPRVDQLQEMVPIVRGMGAKHSPDYYCVSLFADFVHSLDNKDISFNEMWLLFVMSVVYEKTWDYSEKTWINIKS